MLMQPQARPLLVPDQAETLEAAGGLEAVDIPGLRDIADAWQSWRPGDGFPSRKTVDPTRFPRMLTHLYILDRESPPVYWRYRLAGTEIHQGLQLMALKGKGLNEVLPAEAFPTVLRRWEPVAEAGVAVYMTGAIYRDTDSFRSGGRLLLPLSEKEDRTVTGLIGVSLKDPHSDFDASLQLRIRHLAL